jgi:hypothetical protein
MYDILLFKEDDRIAPDWWMNFLEQNGALDYAQDDLNNLLGHWNAEIYVLAGHGIHTYGDRHLVFNNESDCSHFILRWS